MPDFSDPRAAFITLPEDDYEGGLDGWERLAAVIQANTGVVALVPDAEQEKVGSLYVSDLTAMNRKADVGTVVASGEPDIKPGDRMLYAPWAGLWLRPFRVGRLKVKDLRFYGMPDGQLCPTLRLREPMQDVLPAKLDGREIRPIRDMVLIRRDKAAKTSFGLELPDDSRLRPLKATVVAAGPDAEWLGRPLEAGLRVVYNPSAVQIGLTSLGALSGLEGDIADYAFTRSSNLLSVIEE